MKMKSYIYKLLFLVILSGCNSLNSPDITPFENQLDSIPVELSKTPVPTDQLTNEDFPDSLSSTATPTVQYPLDEFSIDIACTPNSATHDLNEGFQVEDYLIIYASLNGETVIYDIDSGVVNSNIPKPFNYMTTIIQECSLVGELENNLIVYNFCKNETEIEYNLPQSGEFGNLGVWESEFSPNFNQALLILGEGNLTFQGFENQDLFYINLDMDKPELNQITNSGDVSTTQWSNSGRYIAFSDNDGDGVDQLFVFDVNTKEIVKLTNYEDDKQMMEHIEWSGDDQRIAFHISSEIIPGMLSVIEVESNNFPIVEEIPNFSNVWNFWFVTDSQIAIYARGYIGDDGIQEVKDGIYLYDLNEKKIVNSLTNEEIPLGEQKSPWGISYVQRAGSPSLVGFLSIGNPSLYYDLLYIYDLFTDELVQYQLDEVLMQGYRYWNFIPLGDCAQ